MPRLTLVMGAPGAGKSTYAKQFPNVVTNDRAARQAPGDIIHQSYKRINELLAAGRDVVFDATGASAAMRKGILGIAKRHGALASACVIDTPLDQCLAAQQGRARPVAESDVRRIHAGVKREMGNLAKEGFHDVKIIRR